MVWHSLKDFLADAFGGAMMPEQLMEIVRPSKKSSASNLRSDLPVRLQSQSVHVDQFVGPFHVPEEPWSRSPLEHRCGGSIEQRTDITMLLEEGCGDPLGHRAFQSFDDDLCFVFADGQQ
jgi:hypothetical protein